MNAECSLPALSMKTRESNPSGGHGLSSIHYMRSDNSMFMILDALIWACCAEGKDGIRAEDMQNGDGVQVGVTRRRPSGLRFLFPTRQAHSPLTAVKVVSKSNKMPPPMRHGDEPSIWQKSVCAIPTYVPC
jgi:hypothetical protein